MKSILNKTCHNSLLCKRNEVAGQSSEPQVGETKEIDINDDNSSEQKPPWRTSLYSQEPFFEARKSELQLINC